MMDIIIPASGNGIRFRDAGFECSKPFISVGEEMIIEHVISSFPAHLGKTVIFTQEQIKNHSSEIKKIESLVDIKSVNSVTDGPLRTIVSGARDLLYLDTPILIANCDMAVNLSILDIKGLMETVDAVLVSFHEENRKINHWSFIQEHRGRVLKVAEKERISDIASLGLYSFRSSGAFLEYAERTFKEGTKFNNEWYVSCIYKEFLIDNSACILNVDKSKQISLGTPYEVYQYMQSLLAKSWI